MIAKRLINAGVTSGLLQAAGFASIAASITTWAKAKQSGDVAHAERFGIFIGLWAPTFLALADLIAAEELASA